MKKGLKRSTALMRPSRVLAGRKSGAEETEMEPHEYDEIIRTLVRIAGASRPDQAETRPDRSTATAHYSTPGVDPTGH
jgi:hypothetical protein